METGGAEMEQAWPWDDNGATVFHVVVDGQVVGALKLADVGTICRRAICAATATIGASWWVSSAAARRLSRRPGR
ncbi:hypothetical protein A5765_20100 [Mycolicibacterium celeriflavum]|nr:hypothetical protein A5765_20100 [Mycolicibacterium celeriflavum]